MFLQMPEALLSVVLRDETEALLAGRGFRREQAAYPVSEHGTTVGPVLVAKLLVETEKAAATGTRFAERRKGQLNVDPVAAGGVAMCPDEARPVFAQDRVYEGAQKRMVCIGPKVHEIGADERASEKVRQVVSGDADGQGMPDTRLQDEKTAEKVRIILD